MFKKAIMIAGSLGIATLSAQIQLTVYNHGEALVKEQFKTQLRAGETTLSREDVAGSIIPASVKLSGGDQVQIIEQNYQYDLVSQNQLLKKYLGAEVTVIQQNGDKLIGSLLSYDNQTLVVNSRSGTEIIQRDFVGSIRCPVPQEKLYTRPTLEWRMNVGSAGTYPMELSYLTTGVSWKAEYVAVLSADDRVLNLSSWIDLNNRSGAAYENAKLKLVAGELHRARKPRDDMRGERMALAYEAKRGPVVQEREFFEYHLYEIQYPVTVRDKEQKQVQWLNPKDLQAQKRFIFERGQGEFKNVSVKVRFKNDKESGTGLPLPAGTVRMFKRDVDGAIELIGEDWLGHTSKDDEVLLSVGEAFDVKGKREVLDRRTKSTKYREEDIRLTIANRKDEAVEVDIIEHMGWSNWQIKDSTQKHEKLDARRAQFTVKVPANSEKVITYTYFQTYR